MTGPFRGRSLRTIRRAACPQAAVPVCDKEKSLADRCRGRRPRRLAEGSRPLPTMQTVKGDTVARLRAGHARPLRTAVKIYAREGQGRAAARPYGWRKVRGQGCRELRPRRPAEGSRPLPTMQTGKGDTMARLRAGHARPLRTAVSGSGGSGALGGAQRAPPVCYANPLVRLFAPQGQTLLAPQFRCAQLWPHARNPATPEFQNGGRLGGVKNGQ